MTLGCLGAGLADLARLVNTGTTLGIGHEALGRIERGNRLGEVEDFCEALLQFQQRSGRHVLDQGRIAVLEDDVRAGLGIGFCHLIGGVERLGQVRLHPGQFFLHGSLDVGLLLGHHLRTLRVRGKEKALLLEKMTLLFKSVGEIGPDFCGLRLEIGFDGEEFVEFWHG
jgi:hypothetical protein